MGVDILGIDILGIDIPAPSLHTHMPRIIAQSIHYIILNP